ncbi:MAG TPA: prepilin-type N-terminal cleavage/methylation domain-containing protein [Casimicrobiaceae bacterium]|nr:prepilin-type N-terminal cleavage/methylation domain-containing protein [Casimicrobiaceae bacterium]
MNGICHRGFTLLELTVALLLLALMSSVLYGTLSLSASSWDRGEAKATQVGDMRLTEEFLRQSLASQLPLRLHKVLEQPLYFQGKSDSLAFVAALPRQVGGGTYYLRIAVTPAGDSSRLALARVIPDYAATALPEFSDAEQSVLADRIAQVRFGYFGRDPDSNDANAPTWRDHWDDPQTLPLLIRVDVAPAAGAPWPQLVVEPRLAPEAGCRAWDFNRNRCVGT